MTNPNWTLMQQPHWCVRATWYITITAIHQTHRRTYTQDVVHLFFPGCASYNNIYNKKEDTLIEIEPLVFSLSYMAQTANFAIQTTNS